MTEEEMKAKIAELEAAVTKAKDDKHAALGEKNKANAALKEAQDAAEQAAADAAEKSGNIEEIKASLAKAHAKELDKLAKANADLTSQLSTLKIDNVIGDAMAKNGVVPHMIAPLTAMFKLGAKFENGDATVDGVPLGDHLTTFFAGKDAAHYVASPVTSGAGAQGSKTNANPHGFTKDNFNSKMIEWAMLQKSDPDQANTIAREVGRDDLAS